MNKVLSILFVLCSIFTLTSFVYGAPPSKTTQTTSQPNTKVVDPYEQLYANCPPSNSFRDVMLNNGFRPVLITSDKGNTVVVWINFKQDLTVYSLNNGTKTCTLFRGTVTSLKVPSGLSSI